MRNIIMAAAMAAILMGCAGTVDTVHAVDGRVDDGIKAKVCAKSPARLLAFTDGDQALADAISRQCATWHASR